MGSLTGCLKTHAAVISDEDRNTIIERRRVLMAGGMKATPAAIEVVRGLITQADATLAGLPAAPAPEVAAPPAAEPVAEPTGPTEAELQAQAQAQAEADAAAKAAIEARRVQRETERDVFRTLVGNPELVGMSLKNVEALVNAKVGDVVSPEKQSLLARAIVKEVAKRAAELVKQQHRDPAVFGAALGAAKEQDNIPADDPAMQAAYALGWTHALQGKTKSTLTGDNLGVRVAGYDAAQEWMKTEEGAAWYEGRPVNKLQNTGLDLRRWYEQMREQMKAGESDIKKAWKQIDRATNRADLFAPLLPDGVTPGYKLYVTEMRDLVRPFKAWLEAAYSWDGYEGGKRNGGSGKSNVDYMLAGDRYPATYSYRKKVTETDSDQFQNDEAFRADWLRQRAAEYIEQVRTLTSVIEGTSSVAEAGQKWHERFIAKFSDQRWNTDRSMLTPAGQALLAFDKGVSFDAWTGEASDVMQFSPEHTWTKNLIANEKTIELPDRADPLRPPRLDRISRDGGADYRKGQNVTPEQFKATFGMADVGFGDWVPAKEDQDHLNYSYDAFMDLAKHFGVDPKHLGFGGALHFTIGALGRGKHAAHFSPNQPSPVGPVKVINVTNTKGDGSVYHEWIHALDHFLFGANFATSPSHPVRRKVIEILQQGVLTPERVEATARRFLLGHSHWVGNKRGDKVQAAITAMNRRDVLLGTTAYKSNADKLSKDYWGSEHEMLARASEAWAFDTLGHTSDYLVNGWVADGKVTQASGYRGTPYPTGAERKQFNLVLGALAKAVKWSDGRPSVTLADFEAALPDEIKAGEKRRDELDDPRGMRLYMEQINAEREEESQRRIRENDERIAEEQRRLDELAEQKLRELEPSPATVDAPQPSEAQGPLSDEELSNLFDQAAAELREETQEQPDVPATVEPEITRPEWTAEDWRAVHRVLAKGTPVLLAEEGHGIPTIHEFARLGKTDMLGYGVFKTVGDGWTANWDGGGAMARTPSGMAYTTVQFGGGAIPAGVYDMQAAADAALANARALESVSSVSSVPARPAAQTGTTPNNSPATSRESADPTARELIAKAAELGVKGADEALTGLAKLFGSKPGRLNSFPAGFDEEAYKEAKPHFKAALTAFQEAGKTLKDLFKFLIQNLGDGVKQYAIQFAKEEGLGNNLAPQDKTAQSLALARDIERHLLHVQEPMDWRTLFNMADRHFGGTQAEDKYTPKDAYDALEAAINLRILRSPTLFTPGVTEEDAQRTVAALTRLIEKIPTQTKRTEEQDRLQQFSTVPPLAFVANWVAGVRATDVMMEPSAGLGGLAVFAKNAGARVVLNEWSARRAALLQQVFPDSKVFQEDAEQLHNILPDDVQPTVVVMNPPFSNSTGGIKDTMVGANHVEQMLKRLPDGGRLVAIVGEGMARDKAAFKGWWKKIDARYDVRAAIPMDGKGYAKYGTTFDNVILVIDKVAPSGRKPVVTPAKEYTELVHLLAEVRNDRPEANTPQQDHSAESDPRGADGGSVPAGDGSAVPAGAETGDGGAAGVGPGQPGGEPGVGGSGTSGGAPRGGRRPRGAAGGDRTDSPAADPNANGSGAADAAAGGGPGAAGNTTGLTVESADTAAASAELTDSVFEGYQPKFLRIPGAKPHPGALVESAAMSSVNPPRPTYTPNLPKETIEKGLVSLAQLESTVYAGQAHSQLLEAKVGDTEARDFGLKAGTPYRRGFFIGDGTGVGKGREISAILLDNIRQGRKKHVWVSEKQGLMNDAARDFAGIQEGVTPDSLIKSKALFNQNDAKADEAIKQADGILFTTYSTLRSAAQSGKDGGFKKGDTVEVGRAFGAPGSPDFDNTKLVKIDKKKSTVTVEWPGGKKIEHPFAQIVAINGDRNWTTTIGDKAQKPKTRVDQLVDWLGPDFDGVIAFDEAHNAGNAVEIKGERGTSEPSAQAMAVVELQRRLPGARVVYVSATGATEVSNLSFANRLGIWGPGTPFASVKEFISNMVAGGLATMELVARDLKQTGSYMARSLSFDGVSYSRLEHELSEDQHAIYNRITDAWQVVLNNMEEAMKATGILSESGKTKNSKAKSAALSAFWGAQQRFFNQIITSMQMPSVLESVEADLARGDAVVLQLVNTNEAQQERAMAKKTEDGEEAELDDLDLTPRDALIDMVRKAFPVNQYRDVINEEGKRVTEIALDSEGNPIQNKEMVAKRDALIKDLQDIKVPDGPLELLVNHFGPEVVAEITGRKQRVVSGRWNKNHKGEGEPKAYVERLGGAKVRADADAFMADKKRILVFSDAGGTGFSFQADLGKVNQRKRQHYLIQPGWRANKAVQGLGRTHRTNQKSAPHYKLVATNIPAHKRFLSSIARRLDQLGALTKGQRDTSSGGLFSEKDNLESKYAERAVRRFLEDAMIGQVEGVNFQDLLQQLGLKDMINPDTRQITESKVPGVRQFLNRLLSLSLEMQDKVFGAFIDRMEQTIEEASQRGELDTGMQTIRALETKVVSEETIYTDERTGADTNLVEIEATHPTRIFGFPTIKNTDKDAGYVVNARSGRVWKKARSGTATLKSGLVVERYWMEGTGGAATRTEEDFKDKAGWRSVTEEEARALWEKENAAKPPTYTTRTHMIVGAMLPIWDRLKTDGVMQVARTQTVDGRRLLGRVVHQDDIADLRKRLNLASPESKLAPAEVLARVLKGEVAELANNWRLERARVSDDLRVEIKGMPSVGPALTRELTDAGVIMERIQWNTRYFIPVNKPEVLAAVIKNRPVVALAKPSDEPKLSQLKQLPAGEGVPAPDVREMAARVAAAWADNPDAPALYVVETAYRLPRDILASLSNMGAVDTTRGLVMPDGRVYLVADKLRSIDEAQSVLFHEVYGHMGMRAFLGDQYESQMMLLRMANPKLAGEANTWYANYSQKQIAARVKSGMSREAAEHEVRLLAVEEALADRAGTAPPPSAWKSVMAKLIEALRSMRLTWVADKLEKLTEAQTHALLMNARRAIDRTGGPMHRLSELPATMQPKRAAEAPPFFSALLAEVNKAPMKAGPASAWGQYLDALAKKGAVKADEIEWTGLREWLQMQEGKVTKDQVGQFLAANGVQVTETVLGASAEASLPEGWSVRRASMVDGASREWALFDDEGEIRGEGDTREEAVRDGWDPDEAGPDGVTKYGQYTLPGGTNYREVLLTLPGPPGAVLRGREAVFKRWEDRVNAAIAARDRAELAAEGDDMSAAEASRLRDQAWRNYQAVIRQRDDEAAREAGEVASYRSKHWDQPNILAHIRLNDRTSTRTAYRVENSKSLHAGPVVNTMAEAEAMLKRYPESIRPNLRIIETEVPVRTLFVEEIQSDFGQDTKKQRAAIAKAVDADFEGIVRRMEKAGVLTVECD